MATHSSVLAWRIPGTGEPGGLPSIGSHRVGHDWRDLAAAADWIMTTYRYQVLIPRACKYYFISNCWPLLMWLKILIRGNYPGLPGWALNTIINVLIWERGRLDGHTLVAQLVKNLPAVQETWVQSLSQEDPLEKEMATHSSILAWRIPGTEEPDGLPSMGLHRVRHDWRDLAASKLGRIHKDSTSK